MTTAIPYTCQMCGLPITGFPWWVQARPYHANCIDPPRTYHYAPNPNPGAGCQPLIPLTEEDVRRIVREEFGKWLQDEIEKGEPK